MKYDNFLIKNINGAFRICIQEKLEKVVSRLRKLRLISLKFLLHCHFVRNYVLSIGVAMYV
jgi:hypothetical protein